VAGYTPPQTEAELLARVPQSNMPGVLSRDLLPPGERVLYETRPSLLLLYWGRLTFIVLYLLLFTWFGASIGDPIGAALFDAPAAIWLVVILLRWWHLTYALTDQRVIRISGVTGSDFMDAAYSQIHNLTSEPGGLRFDASPPVSGMGLRALTSRRIIKWEGIPDVPRTYTFVQEAFAFGMRQSQLAAATQAAVDKLVATSVKCAYCGTMVEISGLDPSNPRCPRCAAPLTLGP
jgi:hypothetical protein